VEADGDPWQGPFSRSKGSSDLAPPRIVLCFLLVTDMWSLMTVPGAHAIWRRLARVVGPWILVLNTWQHLIHQEVLGLMRCHGRMASCVPTRRHVAWCGSHWAHMMSCAYLSRSSSDVCKWYIHFDRLDESVTMEQFKWEFGTIYDDAILMPSMHLLSITSFHVHFDGSCNKS
jgi:hypothetical protein